MSTASESGTPLPFAARAVTRELDRPSCVERLKSHSVGRIGWQAADGPMILPITYAWYDDTIVFRTSPYGVLSELIRPRKVALHVDELDEGSRSGWSVLVRGTVHPVASPSELVRLWTVDDLSPWADGVRNLFMSITPHHITGRVIMPSGSPIT